MLEILVPLVGFPHLKRFQLSKPTTFLTPQLTHFPRAIHTTYTTLFSSNSIQTCPLPHISCPYKSHMHKYQNPCKKMPPIHSSPFHPMENPAIISQLLHHTTKKPSKNTGGGLFRMFKLLPMLSTGCKMVALLGNRHRKPLLADKATTGTLFGYRKGRLTLAIQEDPHHPPIFVIELPMLTSALHKEMASDILRIAMETDTKTHKKKLLEEFVWAVYCNGRKMGYSIRRKNMTDDEVHVMRLLRGVSMGAGVLPAPDKETAADGELTYIRARFERVIGSKDSESFYMINPDGASGQELSIFFLRVR